MKFFCAFSFFLCLILAGKPCVNAEWIAYDDGDAVHAGSGLKYQGVRFSLPDDAVRASLRQISFFYWTNGASCPVGVYLTDHSRSGRLAERLLVTVQQGWNVFDVSDLDVSVPHHFYVALENLKCGFPMLDNDERSERSFKGNHLKSMTTRLSHDLVLRVEIGDRQEIPIAREWDVYVSERVGVKRGGLTKQIFSYTTQERWVLYSDDSFVIPEGIFGLWKQRGNRFRVSLDPEQVREHLFGLSAQYFAEGELADVRVTKITFDGTISPEGVIGGRLIISAGLRFVDVPHFGQITIRRQFSSAIREPSCSMAQE